MIDEYFSSNPQAKWAAYALLGVYVWFMILGPMTRLFTHDPNDKSLANSRSRWFIQLLIGVIPLAVVGFNYYKAIHQPPPPPTPKPEVDLEDFSKKIQTISQELLQPKVVYIPYPSTATPLETPSAPVKK
jgi:hypothetical protein